jgi:hypothetical protein
MPTFNLRRFSHPDTLKSVAPGHMVRFLAPYVEYFQGRNLDLTEEAGIDNTDYEMLAEVLMTPDESIPRDLVEALYIIHEMSTPEAMDELLKDAEIEGILIIDTPEPTPTDVAIQVFLQNRRYLESKHSEQFLTRARTFQYYQTQDIGRVDFVPPTEETLRALESDLDEWFVKHKRGRGSRVFHYIRDDGVWFLVRHGEPYKREGSIEAGESSSVFYRPEKHDVLIYQPATGEIGINAGTKGEKELYRTLFGLHLFGSEDFFPGTGKYTLDPLKTNGADSLVCSDIQGIEWIKLRELQFFWGGAYKEIVIWRADDVFAMLADKERSIPGNAPIIKASFQIKFEDAKNPRTVSIRPSNIAQFQRDDDGELVEAWLLKREFISVPESEEDEEEEELLVGV